MTGRPRLREAIDVATTALAGAGIDSARTDAELLAAHLAGVDRGRLAAIDEPDADFFTRYDELIGSRALRIPLQHLTGSAAFGPLDLLVGPGVFIPRPETEALLEWALAQRLPEDPVIVDLCTGSGALAVALATHWPLARVIAIDDDPTALDYARHNAESTTVEVVRADVTAPGLLTELSGSVDLVVANPPYIPTGAELEPEVAEHDPAHALFGGADGMAVIAPIARLAAGWLRPGGLLAVEHDDTTSRQTIETICGTGCFATITPHCDLAGRPRFVTACRTTGGSARLAGVGAPAPAEARGSRGRPNPKEPA
ncbi:peptide chain release factor N(5)-glutamine methyltransferase [Mycobacterium sp. CVI_P3]|uniref:Release factor glutamine methyltransferase n=1 Tax=Mycobacterium pinniadriaticum TaxID=2994102 RepID=A0ABT3SKH6_9MYCO|nr:peptide chain release factor N(5)-glutamine methyltransferase [Mycobacterium pinniadriaticum]MCX2933600.1 peptide chain release factor N(5)-glutamine methyltransferase [Mycobacterium pinniadriaticum]MCX2940022.1 peptide chain release factor N(5)-glutamine methyltransferase [Mycobacterium pinniadriaticum]